MPVGTTFAQQTLELLDVHPHIAIAAQRDRIAVNPQQIFIQRSIEHEKRSAQIATCS